MVSRRTHREDEVHCTTGRRGTFEFFAPSGRCARRAMDSVAMSIRGETRARLAQAGGAGQAEW